MFIKKKTRCFFPRLFFRTGKGYSRDQGFDRDPEFDRNTLRDSEKCLNGIRDDHHLGSRIRPNLGTGCADIRYRGDRRSGCGIVEKKKRDRGIRIILFRP